MPTVTGLSGQSSIYEFISQMSQIYRQPVLKLEVRRGDLNTLNGVYSDVKTKLAALRDASVDLADIIDRPLEVRKASSSETGVVTATSTTVATLGTHQIKVNALAQNSTMVSDQQTSADTSIATALGAGDYTFTVAAGSLSKQITVTIAADDTDGEVLSEVAYAINTAFGDEDDPVTALALTDTSTTTKLVLKSGVTGLADKLTLTDDTGLLLAQIGIDDESVAATDTAGGYIYADANLDADLVVNGVSVTRGSNVLDDVITGLTLTLHSAQEASDSAVDLTVTADTEAIKAEIEDFIEKYNDALAYLTTKTGTDRETGQRSILGGNSLYRGLLTDLRIAVAGTVTTGNADILMLAQIGITPGNDGTLSISDSTKLDDALAADMNAVSKMFNASDGFGNVLDDMLKPFTRTGGYIDTDTNGTDNKIDALDEQIERMEVRVSKKEQRLIEQYAKIQESMALFSGQQSVLSTFFG